MNLGTLSGYGAWGVMLVALLAGCADLDDAGEEQNLGEGRHASEHGKAQAGAAAENQQQDGAQQALQGLLQIRQEQCRMGNQLACQDLPKFPERSQQLSQSIQACKSGDGRACASYKGLAKNVLKAYSESAAVMSQGAEAMAQMDAWRAQMNTNASASLANLRAQGAAGQAAQDARQQSYDAMNRAWQSSQESSDRTQGRNIDRINEGTTMHGRGVQTRVPYGQTGYSDGNGNVITMPPGSTPPDGWQAMKETYAVRP